MIPRKGRPPIFLLCPCLSSALRRSRASSVGQSSPRPDLRQRWSCRQQCAGPRARHPFSRSYTSPSPKSTSQSRSAPHSRHQSPPVGAPNSAHRRSPATSQPTEVRHDPAVALRLIYIMLTQVLGAISLRYSGAVLRDLGLAGQTEHWWPALTRLLPMRRRIGLLVHPRYRPALASATDLPPLDHAVHRIRSTCHSPPACAASRFGWPPRTPPGDTVEIHGELTGLGLSDRRLHRLEDSSPRRHRPLAPTRRTHLDRIPSLCRRAGSSPATCFISTPSPCTGSTRSSSSSTPTRRVRILSITGQRDRCVADPTGPQPH